MADNKNAAVRKLEEAAAETRRLEDEKARAELEIKDGWTGETMGRYQAAAVALDNARNRERITRQEIEHGRRWNVRGRVKMAELWRRRRRLEEARTWQLALCGRRVRPMTWRMRRRGRRWSWSSFRGRGGWPARACRGGRKVSEAGIEVGGDAGDRAGT